MSVRGQLVKIIITHEPGDHDEMIYFDQILHTNAWQHNLTTGMVAAFFDRRGFGEHRFSRLWSVSENAHNS